MSFLRKWRQQQQQQQQQQQKPLPRRLRFADAALKIAFNKIAFNKI